MRRNQIAQKYNFIYGELDPVAESRADYEQLHNHFRCAKNVYATQSGALFNRAGKRFLADLQTKLGVSGPFCVFSFNSTRDIKYLLVFYDGGFAPFDFEEYDFIYDNNNHIIKIAAPYRNYDFYNNKGIKQIRVKQSANVLYIAHEKYPFAQIKYYGRTTWTYNAVNFDNGPWKEFNNIKGYLIAASATTGAITLTSATENPSVNLTLQPRQLAQAESIESITWTIGTEQGPVISNPPDLNVNAEMAVRYLVQANTDLQTQGSTAQQTITAANNTENYSAKNITCEIILSSGESAERETITFGGSFTQSGGQGLAIFSEDMQGQYIQLKYLDTNTKGWSMDCDGYELNDLVKSGENYYKVVSGYGKSGYQQPKHTEGTVSDGRLMFKYLHSGLGRALITKYISAYQVQAQVLDYMPDGIKTYKWRFGLVDDLSYPNCIDFIDGRMALSYNSAEGPVILLSQSDDYLNFNDFNFGIVDSESAIKMIIQSEFARINWIKRIGPALIAGTDNGIVRLYAPDDGVITTTNVAAPFIATAAASAVLPIDADGNILYVSKDRTNMYLSQYNFQTNAYLKNDLLKLTKFQFNQRISDVCLLEYPFNAVSVRLTDGKNKLLFFDLNEGTKGVFENTVLDLPLNDIVMNYDLGGDEAVAVGIYDNRYLALEQHRNIYDTDNNPPPLDMFEQCQVAADNNNQFLQTITLPLSIFGTGKLFIVYGKNSFALSQYQTGQSIDVSGLKIPYKSNLKAYCGREITVKAVLMPKYADNNDGVNVAENIFQIFNTQNFMFGEKENKMLCFEELSGKAKDEFVSGEFPVSMPSVSHLRKTAKGNKVLCNAPELIIKNKDGANFCITGILSFE